MVYQANPRRYEAMQYRRCGKSGLLLPAVSLGLWHNFGDEATLANCREMLLGAFDCGITHFDLANNYGPSAGSAEETFGRVISEELRLYRDELVISTKAGYYMWPGPYGEWGSKKQLISSLDQSLRRSSTTTAPIRTRRSRRPPRRSSRLCAPARRCTSAFPTTTPSRRGGWCACSPGAASTA